MEDSQELVSVIVTVYNLESRLFPCLKSLSAQSYRNLEILLIDDGSTDGSGRLCDEFVATDSRARVIHQENKGIGAARNIGVSESRGEYLVFPDGDDCFHKDYIRLLLEAINLGGKQYPLAICDFRCVWDKNGVDLESNSEPSFEDFDQDSLLDGIIHYPSCGSAFWGANWNKLYRRSALQRPFQKGYRRCQDYDSNLRFFLNIDKAIHVRKTLYFYNQWHGQSTRSIDDPIIRNECRCLIFFDHYQTLPIHLSAYRSHLLINLYRRLIIWKDGVKGSGQCDSVSRKIRGIEKKTVVDFLTCGLIPLRRKVKWLFFLHAPSLLAMFGKRIYLEKA